MFAKQTQRTLLVMNVFFMSIISFIRNYKCLLYKFRNSTDVEKGAMQAKFIQMSILGAPWPYEDKDIINCVPTEDTLDKEMASKTRGCNTKPNTWLTYMVSLYL